MATDKRFSHPHLDLSRPADISRVIIGAIDTHTAKKIAPIGNRDSEQRCLRATRAISFRGAGRANNIFVVINRARGRINLIPPPLPSFSYTLISWYALEGTHARFCSDVFAGRPANGFRDTIEGSPAGSYLHSACNDSFYSRMHCPHKSVNQTSLTRCYWCLAATGAAVLASCEQASLFSTSARTNELMNRDS